MRGIRGEPVEVWLRNDRPARFVWRGRMHTVIFVLDRQVTPAATPADADPAASGPLTSAPATGGRAAGDPATSGPATSAPATSAPVSGGAAADGPGAGVPATSGPETGGASAGGTGGSECWRVEATPERSVPPVTYELCRDLASGRWLLWRI